MHIALDITDQTTVEVGITDRAQWCAVIDEVDDLFEAADTSEDEFSVLQVSYENIGRLIAQLDDGLAYVDPEVRDDLDTVLDYNAEIITAFSTAEDETAAYEKVDSVHARVEEPDDRLVTAWVAENCGTDISD